VTPALAASSATILKLPVPPAGNANFVRVTLSLSGIRAGAHPRLHAAVSPLGNLGTVAVIGALERKTSRGTNLVYDLAVVNIAAVTPSPANPAVRGGAIELVLRPSGARVRAHHVSIVHDVLTGAGVHLHDFHALFLATRALTGEQYLHVTHVTATRLLQAIARLAGRYGTAFDRDLLELLTDTGGGLPRIRRRRRRTRRRRYRGRSPTRRCSRAWCSTARAPTSSASRHRSSSSTSRGRRSSPSRDARAR